MPVLIDRADQKKEKTDADVFLLDLEDSIAVELKVAARERLYQLVSDARGWGRLAVRINAISSHEGLRDILFMVEQGVVPESLIVPKVESADELRVVLEFFKIFERPPRIYAVIETLSGLRAVDKIAAQEGVAGLILGSADMSAQFTFGMKGRFLDHVRYEVSVAALSENLVAIDAPCFSLKDSNKLHEELASAKEYGFLGKIAIHPSQVPMINDFFTPSPAEVERARKILAMVTPGRVDRVIGVIEQSMVGPPFALEAKKLLEYYDGMKDRK